MGSQYWTVEGEGWHTRLRVSSMIYLLEASSAMCSGSRPVLQVVQRSILNNLYPPIPVTVQNNARFTQLSRLFAFSWPTSACALRPKWYPLSALCPSPCTKPRARCKALAYRQSDGTMLPLTFMAKLAYTRTTTITPTASTASTFLRLPFPMMCLC